MAFNVRPDSMIALSVTPLIHPPPGETSNFINPPTRSDLTYGVCSPLLGLLLILFVNRAYVKLWLMKRVTIDDITLSIAVILTVANYVATVWDLKSGLRGRHSWNISVLQAEKPSRTVPLFLCFILARPILLFLKASFFILYIELFKKLYWVHFASWCGLCALAASHTALAILSFFFAHPDGTLSLAEVPVNRAITLTSSVIGLLFDLLIFAIPIFGLSSLRLSLKLRWGVLAIFVSGGLATFCSALNIYVRHNVLHSTEYDWNETSIMIVGFVEMAVGIICACMPSVGHAFNNQQSIHNRMLRNITAMFSTAVKPHAPKSSPRNSRARSSIAEIQGINQWPRKRSVPQIMRSMDKQYAPYFELDDWLTPQRLSPAVMSIPSPVSERFEDTEADGKEEYDVESATITR